MWEARPSRSQQSWVTLVWQRSLNDAKQLHSAYAPETLPPLR